MKLSYRPEIDGLRAIAVLSVVLYHSDLIFNNFKIFKGGFLGVDIFFTISGYLITSILLKEQFQNKKISLINFYKRRIKRILPTLLIVILTSSILSIFILLPESMEKFAKTVQFSISFLSNIFFWYSQTVYGAEESFLSPLLHTWSLSVEEQFYIFYPLLIIFILSYIKKNFFITMILIFILSLILSIFGNYFVPSFNFFALPTRAWEFIAGGIIAYLEIKKRNHIRNKNLLSLLGLFMIVLSIFYFDRELQHPSLFTLIPVFGTCLIIYFSNFRLCLVKDLLSNNILVYVGLISYSIYLWHFPLFSFAKHLGFYELKVIKVIIIAITFFLSIISYNFIEKYFRNKNINFSKVLIFIFIILISLVIFSYKVIEKEGFPNRLNKSLSKFQIEFLNQKNDTPINLLKKNELLIKNVKEDVIKWQINKVEDKKLKNVLVIGNSHGFDLFTSLITNKDFRKKYNFNLLQGQIKCMEESIKKRQKICARVMQFKHRNQFKKRLKNYYNSDIVIIKTRWSNEDVEALDKLVQFIKKDKKKVIIFSSNPEFNFNTNNYKDLKFKNILKLILYKNSDYIDRFIIKNNKMPNELQLQEINKNYYESIKPNIFKKDILIEKISRKNQVIYFNFKRLLCEIEKKTCSDLTKSNKKIYTDQSGHLSSDASEQTARQIYKLNLLN